MNSTVASANAKRLISLDVMRGAIMILLAAESCLLYQSLSNLALPDAGRLAVSQFFHHPWNGLRFWDLVQPAFMLMAGAALYLSYYYKKQKGKSWRQNFPHVLLRCFKLFVCGVALHCVYAGRLVWELWNVLTQLSITTLIAYLIIRWTAWQQILFSIFLLLLTELLYRFVSVPGYTEPFVSGKNFGNWMDMVLMGKLNSDGWVAINFLPTAAHTIWGVLAGRLIISNKPSGHKINALCIAATICLVFGYGLDVSGITPIIKRISTSSFVLASGGWVLLMLAALYWIADVKGWNRYAWIFTVVGMNAIFIYLFFETVGLQWLNGAVGIFVKGPLSMIGMHENIAAVFSAIVTLLAEWSLCYWLFNRKIFFKL